MQEELQTINVGIFGHIDHGKTTLLKQISGHWADTHSEEMKRGITIKLGYADITIYKDGENYNIEKKGVPVRHVSFIDSPGHEMLMSTTLSGATLIDAAILVVAANEGIKPQTREHLMALQAKRVKNLIVLQNKIDLVSIDQAKRNYEDIKKLLGDQYKNSCVVPVSAQQRANIDEVYRALIEFQVPDRKIDSDPIFVVARSFDINKPGTNPKNLKGAVLGGTLKQGILKVGEEIEIKPGRNASTEKGTKFIPLKAKILSLFRGSKKVQELSPGGSMSIETSLDMSLAKNDALGGNVVSTNGKLPELSQIVSLKYSLFPEIFGTTSPMKVEKIQKKEILMLSVNTSITGGTVEEISSDKIKLDLKVPVVAFKGDNVGIARKIQNHWRLIGYGEIQ